MWIWMVLIASISTGTVLSCTQNCTTCLTPSGYTSCTKEYYLHGRKWVRCPDQECEKCTRSLRCTRCTEGYYLDGHKCTQCPSGCSTCSGLDLCINCTEGYYLDRQQCKWCQKGCETCTGSDRCTRCTDGFYQDKFRCEHCPSECETCTGSDRCTRCTEGYYLDGYQCKLCPPGCATCPGTDRCSNCTDGYYRDRYWCKQCTQGCKTCTEPSICINCHDRFFYDRSRCIECPRNCETCSNYTTCTKCKAGFYGSECNDVCSVGCRNQTCGKTDGSCQHGCMDGFKGNACLRCPDHCNSCTSSTVCASCEAGYFGDHCQPCRNCKDNVCSHDGQCDHGCKNGSYVGTTGCVRCPYDCLTCTSPTLCTSCINEYYGEQCKQQCRNCKDDSCSIDGKCIHGCKDGFFNMTTGCVACPRCLTCTSPTTCTSCNPGYYGNTCDQLCRNCKNNRCSIDGQCTHGCKDGHYQGNIGCDPCPTNCARCESSNMCDQCKPGFHGTTCQQLCRQKCNTCTSLGNCSTCEYGYFGPSCEKCPTLCKNGCFQANGECTGCINGYYKENGQCKTCSNGCTRCKTFDECSKCQSGYFRVKVSYAANCIACGQNCSVCETKDYCNTCYEGYATVNGLCLPCLNCADFESCSSESECPQCIDGFWGHYCEDKCNDTCQRCNKSTGHCTQCTYHTFGQYCEFQCSRNCLQLSDTISTCFQHNGTCKDDCVQGFIGPDCIEEIPEQSSANFVLILGTILAGIAVMVAVVIVGIIMWRRRANRPDLKAEGGQPSGARVPQTVNDNLNPAYNYIDIDPAFESGHPTTPVRINVGSANCVYAVVQKKTTRKSGQPDKSRGQADGADNVYDVASAGQGGAASPYTSRREAEGDTYSHINHISGLRKYRHDNEGTYDHVTHQHLQKAGVDDTYDVTSEQTSRVYDHTVKTSAKTSKDEYSTIGNVK